MNYKKEARKGQFEMDFKRNRVKGYLRIAILVLNKLRKGVVQCTLQCIRTQLGYPSGAIWMDTQSNVLLL